MSETLTSPHVEENPSLIDTELEKARTSLRGRMTRRIGGIITGKDHPVQIVSGKEANLEAIKNAGSHELAISEVNAQLEKARTSLRGRMTRRLGAFMTGKDHPVQVVSGKEAKLSSIKAELEQKAMHN